MIDGMGIVQFYTNITYSTIYFALSSIINTWGGNAFAKEKYSLLKLYLGKAQIIGTFFTLVVFTIHFFTIDTVIHSLAKNEIIYKYGKEISMMYLLTGFFDNFNSINIRYLNVVNLSKYSAYIFLIALPFHCLFVYLFIWIYDMSCYGAGLAYLCTKALVCLLYFVFIYKVNPLSFTYAFFPKSSFNMLGLVRYFFQILPPTFLYGAVWWADELLDLIALQIDKRQDNAYTCHCIVSHFLSIISCCIYGLAATGSVLTSKSILKNRKLTRKIIIIVLVLSYLIISGFIYLINNFKHPLLLLFSKNNFDVVDLSTEVVYVVFICEILDVGQAVLAGFLRGFGLSKQASIGAFISLYLVMLSLAFTFGYYLNYGIKILWYCVALGFFVNLLLYIIMFCFVDLREISMNINIRLDEEFNEYIEERLSRDEDEIKDY